RAERPEPRQPAKPRPGEPPPLGAIADREDRSRRRWLIAALIVLLLAGGALAWFLTRPDTVSVPDVTGEKEAQATIALQEAGFVVATERVENEIPENQVIEQ